MSSTSDAASHGMEYQECSVPLLANLPPGDSQNDGNTSKRNLLTAGIGIIVLIQIGNCMQKAPLLQLFVDSITHQYEGIQKDSAFKDMVQKELVLVRSTQSVLETLPSIALAIPYGAVAQRYGAKLVLALSIFGVVLGLLWTQVVCWFTDTLPLRAVWFSALFCLIGGGQSVVVSMMYTLVSQYSSEDERASIMSNFSAAMLGTDVIALPLTSLLMRSRPWLAILIGNLAFALGLLSICFLGEPRRPCIIASSLQNESNALSELDLITTSNQHLNEPLETSKQTWSRNFLDLCRNRVVLILLVPIFCNALVSGIPDLLVIYVEKRLGWSISQGNLLVALAALVTLGLFGLILPVILSILQTRFELSLQRSDLCVAVLSCSFLIAGSVILASPASLISVVTGVVTTALGAALSVILNNTVSRTIEFDSLSMVYSVTSVVDTIGSMVSAPLLAGVYRVGLEKGGWWIGLPFCVAAMAYSIALITTGIAMI